MLTDEQRARMHTLLAALKAETDPALLRRFGGQDLIAAAWRYRLNFAVMGELKSYARHRAAAIVARQLGNVAYADSQQSRACAQCCLLRAW